MFQIEEFPDLWADACLRDSEGQLMFLSVYGRDGSLMQMLAAIDLGRSAEKGVDSLHLVDQAGSRHLVFMGDAKRLAKHSTKLPKENLFGQLNQSWLYDKRLQQLDRANRIGYVLVQEGADEGAEDWRARAWQLVRTLSPVALLDGWREGILAWCEQKAALTPVGSAQYPALGPVAAWRVSLSKFFTDFVSDEVRQGRFTLDAPEGLAAHAAPAQSAGREPEREEAVVAIAA